MKDDIILITKEQLSFFAEEVIKNLKNRKGEEPKHDPKRYVYGLRGIRELFNVSVVTAHKYKNTFLKPAVTQHGRKIIIDADMAIELFKQFKTA